MTYVRQLADKVAGGGRVDARRGAAAVSRGADAAARPARRRHPRPQAPARIVTYIIDRNVNYTNICVARCNFCAFYRPVGSPRRLRARLRRDLPQDRRDDRRRRQPAAAAGRPQSGSADRLVRGSVPRRSRRGIPSSSCTRCRRRRCCTSRGSTASRRRQVIDRLVAAGLDSIPGGGAEILVDRVRKLAELLLEGVVRRVARHHARGAPGRACARRPR